MKMKDIFKKVDHIVIYYAIAGGYTPFMLLNIKTSLCYVLVAVGGAPSDRGRERWPTNPSRISPFTIGASKSRVLCLLRDQGCAGDAGQATRNGVGTVRDYGERRRTDLHPV